MAISDTLASADLEKWADRLAVVREVEASLFAGGDVREALLAICACMAAGAKNQDFGM